MIEVKAVSREEIDTWGMEESGLPVRVVNSAIAAGIKTVGDLRRWSDVDLVGLRGLGRLSLKHIHTYFELADQLQGGNVTYQTIDELFATFLDPTEIKVVWHRYGLVRKEHQPLTRKATLQEIGNEEHRTRERIRQIQENALHRLRSRMARACFEPFYELFAGLIDETGRVATSDELMILAAADFLAGKTPEGMVRMLCDLHPDKLVYYNGFFSTLPLANIQAIENAAVQILDKAAKAVPLDKVVEPLNILSASYAPGVLRRIISVVLTYNPKVGATLDNRFFLYNNGAHVFLVDLLKNQKRPIHYRAATQVFNDRLQSRSRKGAGFVLDLLGSIPQVVKVDRGVYDLKAE